MKFVAKGNFGYVKSEKKKRALIVIALLLLPLITFIIGIIVNGTNKNILSVVAIVAVLPACRAIVSLIMILKCKPLDKAIYDRIVPHEGSLSTAYELYLTEYEKSAMLDACAFCGNTIVGLILDPKADIRFEEKHIVKMMRANGYSSHVNIMTDVQKYIERLDSMNDHAESLRADFHKTPDDRYPDLEIEGLMFNILLEISL